MTPAITHPRRRATDQLRWYARLWLECTDPLRDRRGAGFSMTKMIAAFFAVVVGRSVELQRGAISGTALSLALAALAAAFGKSTFNYLLSRHGDPSPSPVPHRPASAAGSGGPEDAPSSSSHLS